MSSMPAKILSAALEGLQSVPVDVETDISSGLPKFNIVGLPDTAIREARDRIRSAIKNSGFEFPRTVVTVNLAPADVKKEGPSYDFPIAVSIMFQASELPEFALPKLADSVLVGELALGGELRPVAGVLTMALMMRKHGLRRLFLPYQNADEAMLVSGIEIYPIRTLASFVHFLRGEEAIRPCEKRRKLAPLTIYEVDCAHIRGQNFAKRALEIAAAGGHNLLMTGSPGAGKTMLARSLPSILPPLTEEESLEVTQIWSLAGILPPGTAVMHHRPFRNPHHTASAISLVGGGSWPRPGEVTLAHRGVLFLDELPEFPRHALESLRQPLEDGTVTVSRVNGTVTFPARFMLLGARNPCPCGYLRDSSHPCRCSSGQVMTYQKKISGPLLDRMDIIIDMPALATDEVTAAAPSEASVVIRERVISARERQSHRYRKLGLTTNAELGSARTKSLLKLSPEAATRLKEAVATYHLSARAYYRTIKLAQTIADLAGSDVISGHHLSEAILFHPRNNPFFS